MSIAKNVSVSLSSKMSIGEFYSSTQLEIRIKQNTRFTETSLFLIKNVDCEMTALNFTPKIQQNALIHVFN